MIKTEGEIVSMLPQFWDWDFIVSGLTMLILFVTAIIYQRGTKQAARKSTWEATNEIYKEWYSDELAELRRYFYTEFLPSYGGSKSFNKEEGLKSKEKVKQLCYFFDRVGWLGAANLVDIDYVLGPMQYTVRRVWITTEEFIKEERKQERESKSDKLFDPVYQFGFEWLFKYSNKKHQAKLARDKFRNPKLLSQKQSRILQAQINDDEIKFREKFFIS